MSCYRTSVKKVVELRPLIVNNSPNTEIYQRNIEDFNTFMAYKDGVESQVSLLVLDSIVFKDYYNLFKIHVPGLEKKSCFQG